MINNLTLADLKASYAQDALLTFEEYEEKKEPAVEIILHDFARKAMEKAEEAGTPMTEEEALLLARESIPVAFVPEWMKNLRMGANLAGTEITYLDGLRLVLEEIRDLYMLVNGTAISEAMRAQMHLAPVGEEENADG